MLTDRAALLPDRTRIARLRAELARSRRLVEVRGAGGSADWTEVSPELPFAWDRPRPLAGAKRFFFPSHEVLLRWTDHTPTPAEAEVAPFALVGLHPCDLTAIAYQDRFFADDPWYQRRRAQAFLVSIDCLTACSGAFCRDVGAGPFARHGFDLDLTPLPDGRVLVAPGTAAGLTVLAAVGAAVAPLPADVHTAHAAVEESAERSFPDRPFVERAIARIDARSIPDAEWHAFGPSCFACTGCTNVCPTCSCFTVVDEALASGGTRARTWDSCLLDGFQREASGHNPTPHPGDRVRRFWTHKLEGTFAAACGRLGCVGCGRCDVTCPGSIGALRVLEALGGR